MIASSLFQYPFSSVNTVSNILFHVRSYKVIDTPSIPFPEASSTCPEMIMRGYTIKSVENGILFVFAYSCA